MDGQLLTEEEYSEKRNDLVIKEILMQMKPFYKSYPMSHPNLI